MLTKNKNPKISYISRILVLPLAAFIFFAFTLRMKTVGSVNQKQENQNLSLNENAIRDTVQGSTNDQMRAFLLARISESKDQSVKQYLMQKLANLSTYNSEKEYDIKKWEITKEAHINDTIPKFYKGKRVKRAYASSKLNKALIFFVDGSTDTISINEGEKIRLIPPPPPPPNKVKNSTTNIDINSRSLKIDTGYKKFDKVFTKIETEAAFPGGNQAWLKYIQNILQQHTDLITKENNQGTCLVQFIVDTGGNVSDVKAITMENTRLAEVAVTAIKKGPKWKPAIQNGHVVASYKRQSITFKLADIMVNNSEPR